VTGRTLESPIASVASVVPNDAGTVAVGDHLYSAVLLRLQ